MLFFANFVQSFYAYLLLSGINSLFKRAFNLSSCALFFPVQYNFLLKSDKIQTFCLFYASSFLNFIRSQAHVFFSSAQFLLERIKFISMRHLPKTLFDHLMHVLYCPISMLVSVKAKFIFPSFFCVPFFINFILSSCTP